MKSVIERCSDDEKGRFIGGLRRLIARKSLSMPSLGHVRVAGCWCTQKKEEVPMQSAFVRMYGPGQNRADTTCSKRMKTI